MLLWDFRLRCNEKRRPQDSDDQGVLANCPIGIFCCLSFYENYSTMKGVKFFLASSHHCNQSQEVKSLILLIFFIALSCLKHSLGLFTVLPCIVDVPGTLWQNCLPSMILSVNIGGFSYLIFLAHWRLIYSIFILYLRLRSPLAQLSSGNFLAGLC